MAAAILLAVPGLAGAVTGGTPFPDAAADAVVLIYDDTTSSLCSGALIAPDVVLTAAHCIANPTGNFYVLGGVAPLQSDLFTILAGGVHPHPSYDPNGPSNDIGVLVLLAAAPANPLSWSRSAADYGFGNSVGMIGYGTTSSSIDDSGTRRVGTSTISYLDSAVFLTDDTIGQGMCLGDAGGPAFITDEINGSTIIGVSSYGDQNCASFSAFERTDAHASFIEQFVPEPGAVAAAVAAIAALGGLAAAADPTPDRDDSVRSRIG